MRFLLIIFLAILNSGLLYSQNSFDTKRKSTKDIFWGNKQIAVCWENPSEDNKVERHWVQEAITRTWQKESQLDFTDWCPCNEIKNKSQVIRIQIADDEKGPRVIDLGSKLNNVPNGMVLNFSFKKWGTTLIPEMVSSRKNAIEAIAIH